MAGALQIRPDCVVNAGPQGLPREPAADGAFCRGGGTKNNFAIGMSRVKMHSCMWNEAKPTAQCTPAGMELGLGLGLGLLLGMGMETGFGHSDGMATGSQKLWKWHSLH